MSDEKWSVILCFNNYIASEEIFIDKISHHPINKSKININSYDTIVLTIPNIVFSYFNIIILHLYIKNKKHKVWYIDKVISNFEDNQLHICYNTKNVKYFCSEPIENQVTIE